ncbi:hypothetical protein PROAA_180006 [Candidatus Propionivibrio aalborgensis]|uniref:Uncharacterized protein n=1 Tax=Candidatus Propionivibrio aalborgensis TaxID=1860101 RepID=A0A1A8XNF3_9RHOO|nr:hypothetical protein PROAA_180006 [Candidatus Propionivibrio aalborgensis]
MGAIAIPALGWIVAVVAGSATRRLLDVISVNKRVAESANAKLTRDIVLGGLIRIKRINVTCKGWRIRFRFSAPESAPASTAPRSDVSPRRPCHLDAISVPDHNGSEAMLACPWRSCG